MNVAKKFVQATKKKKEIPVRDEKLAISLAINCSNDLFTLSAPYRTSAVGITRDGGGFKRNAENGVGSKQNEGSVFLPEPLSDYLADPCSKRDTVGARTSIVTPIYWKRWPRQNFSE